MLHCLIPWKLHKNSRFSIPHAVCLHLQVAGGKATLKGMSPYISQCPVAYPDDTQYDTRDVP